ncbi:MAG: ArnT family glycosyltransferase [Gemmatimonadaceae bacterium]
MAVVADSNAPMAAVGDGNAPIAAAPLRTRHALAVFAMVLVAFKLAMHVVAAAITPFEFHRDEFLYFAMGNHLQLLRMDFPPMIAMLAEAVRAVAGSSLFAYRVVPALAGTAIVWLAVLTARELGGGRTAQVLTAVAVIFNPLFLRAASLFQPVVFDQFWWMLGFYALVRIGNSDDRRWWILLGVAGGLGLLSKFSILFFGAAVLAGLLLTRQRDLRTAGPWMALGIALVLGAPSLIGQVTLDWPLFDQMAGLKQGQLDRITLIGYVGEQLLWGPASFVFAVAGAVAFVRAPALVRHRVVGWSAIAAFVLYAVTKGKSYYVGPIYPVLFAGAGVWVEQLARPGLRRTVVWSMVGLTLLFGIATLPFGLPVLPPEQMARYAAATGVTAGVKTNRGELLALPQDYADMTGWREKAEAVAAVYGSLPPAEQAEVVLYGNNYGQAGALEFYGRALALPRVVSLAGSFYLFGPGQRPGKIVIFLGVRRSDLEELGCASLDIVARVKNRWGVPEEQDVPILICRKPKLTVQEIWKRQHPHWG